MCKTHLYVTAVLALQKVPKKQRKFRYQVLTAYVPTHLLPQKDPILAMSMTVKKRVKQGLCMYVSFAIS